MKIAGIIGGTGPDSTIEYYRMMIRWYRAQKQDGSYPSVIINSIDMKKMLDLIGANQLAEVTEYLLEEVHRLAAARADFALLASNTPHIVFDELRRRSPIPLISIVEAARDWARNLCLSRLGLFGTRFTMEARFYDKVFTPSGIRLLVPNMDERAYIHDKYMNELLNGVFLHETRSGLLAIVKRLKEKEGIEGVILAGTELPLILKEESYEGIPFLDTTKIHVQKAVEWMLSSCPKGR